MKYIQRIDGEGFTIKNKVPFRLACCDCGLIHDFVIAAPKLRTGVVLGIAAKRNNRATAKRRAKKGNTK